MLRGRNRAQRVQSRVTGESWALEQTSTPVQLEYRMLWTSVGHEPPVSPLSECVHCGYPVIAALFCVECVCAHVHVPVEITRL